jgi:hypothetical protein
MSGAGSLSRVVMRRRSTVVLLGVVGAAVMALALGVRHRRSAAPDLEVNLLGYTNRGGFLVAEMQVTNKGPRSVMIYQWDEVLPWGSLPFAWAKARTLTGWKDGGVVRPIAYFLVVPPKSSEAFAFALPGGTLRWRYGFSFRTAYLRERTACKLSDRGVISRVDCKSNCGRLLALLFRRQASKGHHFQSAVFDVGDSGHNPASPVDGGIPLQPNTGRPYPAATDPRRSAE